MRSKKSFINVFLNLIQQIVNIICGLVLPRLILEKFGSQYNGLLSSITQFLSCAVLLRAGIGGATRAALYKPIAENNLIEISSIIKATNIFMKKIALILMILIIVFSFIYPVLVIEDFDFIFSCTLFLIIGISTFAETLFGITYLILLQADQKLWISSVFRIISLILNVFISVILLKLDCSIHIVKFGSAIAFVVYPVLLNIYVNKTYKLEKNVKPNNISISQRWDAFWHQVATFITNNTDVIIITIFLNMLEVSVYSVYNMIVSSLKNIVMAFVNGLEAAFGNMIAKNEKKVLNSNFSIIEFIIFNIATIIYSCCAVLIIDFVKIYTNGINDINYLRPIFAYIILLSQYFYCIRIPYQLVVQAAGKYKETKNGSMVEAVLNIVVSIILVKIWGLIGVAIGTLISIIFRTFQLYLYVLKNIINELNYSIIFKSCVSIMECIIIILISNKIFLEVPLNYLDWFKEAIVTFGITISVVGCGILLFYKNQLQLFIEKIKKIIMEGK